MPILAVPEVEPNDGPGTANPLPLGFDANENSRIDVNGFLNPGTDTDTFSVQLDGGDILGLNVTGAAGGVSIIDSQGFVLVSSDVDYFPLIFPIDTGEIPLPKGGNASLARVISVPGTYFVQVSDADPGVAGGAYTAEMRLFRPVLENNPVGTHQKLFLDFNGASIDTSIFTGTNSGIATLSPLSSFLANWGLSPVDEDLVIDGIVARVADKLGVDIRENGENGDWLTSQTPGEFDIEILNSRDHGDVFGQPHVSRIIVGGSTAELGIGTIGIAESIDVGNFDTRETAVTLLDLMSVPGGGGDSLNGVPLAPDASMIDLVAAAVGDVTGHEAGHFFGLYHTENMNTVLNLIDQGGIGVPNLVVGPDGIFGNGDDTNFTFIPPDIHIPNENLFMGTEDTLNTLSWGLATGKILSSIQGVKFHDLNGNSIREGNEPGLSNWLIFADLDGDGIQDLREPRAMTGADGSYELFVPPGLHTIREVLQPGWIQTFPGGDGSHEVLVRLQETVTSVNFGNQSLFGGISGTKWNDEDGDGVFDQEERGLPGVIIYLDLDGDNRLDLGEPAAETDMNGNYSIAVPNAGTFTVREVLEPGFELTFPNNLEGEHTVTVPSGGSVPGTNFGNHASVDFGDAPDRALFNPDEGFGYPTLFADDGARHDVLQGFGLGLLRDGEGDGNPTITALGDDNNFGGDDEDGVVFLNSMAPGRRADMQVTVSTNNYSPGRLNVWADFNLDGDWDDAGEHLLLLDTDTGAELGREIRLQEGVHDLSFDVPADADAGLTYLRFRYGYKRDQVPTGDDMAGEVEDYRQRILGERPEAIDDQFTLTQSDPPVSTPLTVFLNDIPSLNEPTTIVSVSATTSGGSAVITGAGTTITYTPPQGFVGDDTFSYTIRDAAGNTDPATVSIKLLPSFDTAIAVDDSFDFPSTASSLLLPVLANDFPTGFVSIVNLEPPSGGTAAIDDRGTVDPTDDQVRYTPNQAARQSPGTTDQFRYTIEDGQGNQSTAFITVHVNDQDDDRVRVRLVTVDQNGNPISNVGVGEEFTLQVFLADDLRLDDEDGDPLVDRFGVAGGYLDVLFDFNRVSLSGTPAFNGPYGVARSFQTNVPGLINEVGAFQTGDEPLGRTCQIDQAGCNPVSNEFLLVEFPMRAVAAGPADFIADPADRRTDIGNVTPDHDMLLFNPAEPVPLEHIRYESTTLQVFGAGGRPIPVDNTFHVATNVTTVLDVLANDIELVDPPLRITGIGQVLGRPLQTGSRVEISDDGTMIEYTPRAGFVGTEQFTYDISNANNAGSNFPATVTVVVGESAKDVNIRLELTDLSNNVISTIPAGNEFKVRAYVDDIRTSPPDPTRTGVFSVYFDLLYDSGLVATIPDSFNRFGFDITFSSPYDRNGLSANNSFLNVIEETGAFQSSTDNPTGPAEFLVYETKFRALVPGNADFVADPPDVSPFHDILLFEPPVVVPLDRVRLGFTELTITGAAPEGEFTLTNAKDSCDVNDDSFCSPIDALLVVNDLSKNGSRPIFARSASAEGQYVQPGTQKWFLDVTGDKYIAPDDVLMIVNKLSRGVVAHSEGSSVASESLATSVLAASFVPPPSLQVESQRAANDSPQATSSETHQQAVDAVHRSATRPFARTSEPQVVELEGDLLDMEDDLLDMFAKEQTGN